MRRTKKLAARPLARALLSRSPSNPSSLAPNTGSRIARSHARCALFVACLFVAASALGQVGHPVKGSWLGYWGPNAREQHRMFLVLDWENREIVGTINPGPNAVPLERAEIDYATWTLTIEAEMPLEAGGTARYVATGKLENLGSWVNRRYSGTYQYGDETGTFLLTLN